MLVLGLSNMRDASAALVEDGRVIAAAEEERFVRIKHVTALPLHAIRYCLKEAGIAAGDLDAIAVPWKYWVWGDDPYWRLARCCDRRNSCKSKASGAWNE
jgi:Predicted carbamoyl transferase, NodU family